MTITADHSRLRTTSRVISRPRTMPEPLVPAPEPVTSRFAGYLALARVALCFAGGAGGPAMVQLMHSYQQQASR